MLLDKIIERLQEKGEYGKLKAFGALPDARFHFEPETMEAIKIIACGEDGSRKTPLVFTVPREMFTLPDRHVWMEFDVDHKGKRLTFGAFLMPPEHSGASSPDSKMLFGMFVIFIDDNGYVHTSEKMFPYMDGSGKFYVHIDADDKVTAPMNDDDIHRHVLIALSALFMINAPTLAEHVPGPDMTKLNKRRVKRGKHPLVEHRVVRLKFGGKRKVYDETGETGHKRRFHSVRSHIRMVRGKPYIVAAHWRGDAGLGRIEKTYEVEPAGKITLKSNPMKRTDHLSIERT